MPLRHICWLALLPLAAAAGDAEKKSAEKKNAPVPEVSDDNRLFWAFRPPLRPAIPKVKNAERVGNPIDAFLLEKLEAKGLTFSPAADRRTLIRRASFDLLGLPPDPEEVVRFVADADPAAYEKLIDRLLASPHYGERWGRHWLDAAGYVDTVGPDNDAEIIRMAEGMWRYRDYVVRSFNADKPYDRFLQEQLAGDELVEWRSAGKYTPEMLDALVATGFLRTAVDNTTETELNRPLERYEVLHGTLEVLSSNLLGLTVGCARCHDHKFDPIPQSDYYRLMACLTPSYNPAKWLQPPQRFLDDVSAVEKVEIQKANAELDRQAAERNLKIAMLQEPHEQRLREARLEKLPEPARGEVRALLALDAAKRSKEQKALLDKHGPALKVAAEEVQKSLSPEERAAIDALNKEISALKARLRTTGKVNALFEVGAPPATPLLRRGSHLTPGPEVAPGFLAVLTDPKRAAPIPSAKDGAPSSGRRTALAQWLTRPEHPLTARVIVNRIWQHHFGEGIVVTPDNFGLQGARPTHPQLLDWLATEFVRLGWKWKPIHKLILTSAAYQQSSESGERKAQTALDPGNQLLWRMRLRRLESEAVRDAILTVSSKLDRTQGGPPIPIQVRKDGMVVVADKGLPSPTAPYRRSLYLLNRRNYQLSLLRVFDQPQVASNCTRRTQSTVPLQSLTLMNDAFLFEQADHLAQRVAGLAGTSDTQVRAAYRLALTREPDAMELKQSLDYLDRQRQRFLAEKMPAPQAESRALTTLCHVLMCTNEFLYVD